MRAAAVLVATCAVAGLVAGCRTPGPPHGLTSCSPAPRSDSPAADQLVATVSAPKSVARDRPVSATIRLRATSGTVPFAGGIPLGLLVLARDRVVGSYLGPLSGTERSEDIDAEGITFHVTGVVKACGSAENVGTAALPPGHYDLVATIEQSVGTQVHTLVTERRSIQLTG
jgi:hypothetical protein